MNETFVESEYKSFFDSIQTFQSQIQKLDTVVHKDIHTIELEKERAEQFLNEERIINFSKDQLILLNVGGKYFTTYHKTLTNYPSLLKAMFSGRIELYPLEDGSYFIDRDPDLFFLCFKLSKTWRGDLAYGYEKDQRSYRRAGFF